MSLYKQIKENFKIKTAYEEWAAYRKTLTDYLIGLVDCEKLSLDSLSHISVDLKLPTIAIVGAGACNDIDLNRILPYFSKITLIDVDEHSVHEALCREGLQDSKLIEKRILSLTGIMDEDYKDFIGILQCYLKENMHHITPQRFSDYAIDCMEQLYKEKSKVSNLRDFGQYDYVWCFGVHSQLQSMFGYIYNTFLAYLKEEVFSFEEMTEHPFFDKLRIMNKKLIPEINDLLIESSNECTIIGNEWDLLHNKNENYILCDSPGHAIEGAYQAICDIRKRENNCYEKMLLWPFSEEKEIFYMVLIQEIKK
ncbi:MAG: hypothetical protein ACI4F4_06955 [Lachnospiraceae bacterium]